MDLIVLLDLDFPSNLDILVGLNIPVDNNFPEIQDTFWDSHNLVDFDYPGDWDILQGLEV